MRQAGVNCGSASRNGSECGITWVAPRGAERQAHRGSAGNHGLAIFHRLRERCEGVSCLSLREAVRCGRLKRSARPPFATQELFSGDQLRSATSFAILLASVCNGIAGDCWHWGFDLTALAVLTLQKYVQSISAKRCRQRCDAAKAAVEEGEGLIQ